MNECLRTKFNEKKGNSFKNNKNKLEVDVPRQQRDEDFVYCNWRIKKKTSKLWQFKGNKWKLLKKGLTLKITILKRNNKYRKITEKELQKESREEASWKEHIAWEIRVAGRNSQKNYKYFKKLNKEIEAKDKTITGKGLGCVYWIMTENFEM